MTLIRNITLIIGLSVLASACQKQNTPSSSLEVAVIGLYAGALSYDGHFAIIGSINHGGSLWRLDTQERLFNWNHIRNEATTIVACDISSDAKWGITATVNDLVLWSIENGEGIRFWKAPGEILDVKLGPEANMALLGLSDHSAVIFDIRRGGILQTFALQNRVRSVDLSGDGKLALTGAEDFSAILWDVKTGKELHRFMHDADVQLVRLSDDGSLALSVSKYDKALLWQTSTGEVLGEIPLNPERIKRGIRFTAAKFSADNQYLLTGRPDQWVELWQIQTMQRIDAWELPKRDKWKPTGTAVVDVAFGNSETQPQRYYAIASNGFVHTLSGKADPGN